MPVAKLTIEQIKDLIDYLSEKNVASFTQNGLTINFYPNTRLQPEIPDIDMKKEIDAEAKVFEYKPMPDELKDIDSIKAPE